jgi:hypothetical protein
MKTSLNLSLGIYNLNYLEWRIEIRVDYANKRYSYIVNSIPKKYTEEELVSVNKYVQRFALKMIESKSDRNFFDSNLLKA